MLEAKSLNKAAIPESLITQCPPTTANGDASSCWVYIASGSCIYKFRISMEGSVVGQGKESLLIPQQTQARVTQSWETWTLMDTLLFLNWMLAIQMYDGFTFSVSPRDYGVGEGSWAGVCFNPNELSMVAVVRSFGKSIDIYDQDIHLRTMWYPSSLIFMDNSGATENSMLAVTEAKSMGLESERERGCVHRIMGSVGDMLYAVSSSSSSSGNIAVGGADRTVTIYDPCRWSALSRWLHCSKYEITGLNFSSVNPDYIYVQGVDYEVLCGEWRKG